MNIDIPYAKSTISIKIDDDINCEIIRTPQHALKDEKTILSNALNNPSRSKIFSQFLDNSDDLLIIVNDPTRPTPTANVIDQIYDEIKDKNLKFLIATGTHRKPTDSELNFIFKDKYKLLKERIYIHDSKQSEMAYLGTSKNGNEIYLNNMVKYAQKIITINSVEPHYYAGFTGGRKSFLPGVASYETIERNHKHALSDNASSLNIDNNPVHLEMMEVVSFLQDKEIFSIQLVLDQSNRIFFASAGDIKETFIESIKKALNVFAAIIEEKADIVVTCATFPLDIDFYQSHKALDNGARAVKDGGTVFLVSECRDGIGNKVFYEYLKESKKPKDVFSKIDKKYRLGAHIAANISKIALKNDIRAYTDLDDHDIENMFIKPSHDLQKDLDRIVSIKKPNRIIFLIHGSMIVPYL
jgi:lactate racemase